ncbi:MAG: IS3 family transposase, partial [Roseimicrobium sp.]
LGQFIFNPIAGVKEHTTRWLWTYNNQRSNMGIGGITPAMSRRQA